MIQIFNKPANPIAPVIKTKFSELNLELNRFKDLSQKMAGIKDKIINKILP